MNQLATIDKRHPITIAIDFAHKQRMMTPDRRQVLVGELRSLVTESSKRFVGFMSIESVRKALDITLGIVSLSVVDSTKGKFDPESWAGYVLDRGISNLATEAIKLVRPVATSSPYASFEGFTPDQNAVKTLLLDCAKSRDKEKGNVWNGYEHLRGEVRLREENKKLQDLAFWLIPNLVETDVKRWIVMQRKRLGSRVSMPSVNETVNTLVFRYCCGLSVNGALEIQKGEFARIRAQYMKDKKVWVQHVRSRFDQLLELIPVELHAGLRVNSDDWFKAHLSKGPPKVPKKWNDAVIPGISGVYEYKMFEK